MKYSNFIFQDYTFDSSTGLAQFYYSFDGEINFCETYKFDFEFVGYDEVVLDRALQSLFFMAGVSYYKAYLSDNIVIDKGEMTKIMAAFFSKTYQKGLGEFFYRNKLDPKTKISFPANSEKLNPINNYQPSNSTLIGIGGGKDSLVSVELLRKSGQKIATWSLGHRSQLEGLIEKIGLEHYWVERDWDKSLLSLNQQGAYNGHIPISAIIACVGSVVAVLSGHTNVAVSNEQSASEPSLVYEGVEINHQYSKSLEFEKDYQAFLSLTMGTNVTYFSFLRPLSEVRIAEVFSVIGFGKYRGLFSSCNQAFTHQSDHIFWCGKCPKCAFTYLVFAPFIKESDLISIWGKNLLLEGELRQTYENLLGISGQKPLDCVGEIKEARVAMQLNQKKYPELSGFVFDVPPGYDYKGLGSDTMPRPLRDYLESSLNHLGI